MEWNVILGEESGDRPGSKVNGWMFWQIWFSVELPCGLVDGLSSKYELVISGVSNLWVVFKTYCNDRGKME